MTHVDENIHALRTVSCKHMPFCTPLLRLRRSRHVITVLDYLSDRVGLANHAVANNHDGNAPAQLCATGYLVCSVEMPGI